ncbi:MAG: WYL domain-containing protein, partial [Eubacterium sp.]|nr:WYL domain-containing protein [Eubacterium sp.]
MAYSELIKNFAKIREYMSQFFIYGFKSRTEYKDKSARSYDNERRRIESWLGDYMSFHQDVNGKNTFIAVDSRNVSHNPLYNAFKAKSFTDNDIMLHFYILDILSDDSKKSIKVITDTISSDYISRFSDCLLDESTIRKKLKEYEKLGIIKSEKNG